MSPLSHPIAADAPAAPGADASPTTRIDSRTDRPDGRGRFRHKDWRATFESAYRDALRPGAQVLDVGSGRRPTIPVTARPSGVRYVGLDISRRELANAPVGSYDETHVSDVEVALPELAGRFDLIVSWQVLEHVRDLEATLATLRGYLGPTGTMVLEFTGKWSIPGVLGRVVPDRLGHWGLVHLVGRRPEGIFPAHFDRCSATELRHFLRDSSELRIEPRFSGAGYFRRVPIAGRVWSRFEDLMIRGRHDDLASYYLVVARR